MFTLQEAALAYAKGAERILGEDGTYINNNQELVPVFVSLLFQSLEISLKHLGLEARLFTKQQARDRKLTGIVDKFGAPVKLRLDRDDDFWSPASATRLPTTTRWGLTRAAASRRWC